MDRDVRLVLALGASEPCHSAEDDDEDDADEETPAVSRMSVMLRLQVYVEGLTDPFAMLKSCEGCVEEGIEGGSFEMVTSHVLA